MAFKLQLLIDQGVSFSQQVDLLDDSGDPLVVSETMECSAQIRKSYISNTAISFTTNLSNGSLILSLQPTDTMNLCPGKYLWDCIITDTESNTVSKPLEGLAIINPLITYAS